DTYDTHVVLYSLEFGRSRWEYAEDDPSRFHDRSRELAASDFIRWVRAPNLAWLAVWCCELQDGDYCPAIRWLGNAVLDLFVDEYWDGCRYSECPNGTNKFQSYYVYLTDHNALSRERDDRYECPVG